MACSLDIDEAERRVTEYLQKKLNPKQIMTQAARFDKLGAGTSDETRVAIVSGWLQNQDGTGRNFEVTLTRLKGDIIGWKTWSK